MDKAGILMLDSIREIFDILGIEFELVKVGYEEHNTLQEFVSAIVLARKCPVILDKEDDDNHHAMLATGVFEKEGLQYIECKNSHRENPNQMGMFIISRSSCFNKHVTTVPTCHSSHWASLLGCLLEFGHFEETVYFRNRRSSNKSDYFFMKFQTLSYQRVLKISLYMHNCRYV